MGNRACSMCWVLVGGFSNVDFRLEVSYRSA